MRVGAPSILALGLSALTAANAGAGDATTAEALFREGRAAMDAQDFARACDLFAESHRLGPAPGTSLNIGDCSERLGRVASAWQAYVEARDRLPESDDRRAFAASKVVELEPRLPRVRFSVKPPTEGCVVHLDREALGRAGQSVDLPTDPGPHAAELHCEGREPSRSEFSVLEGALQVVELKPGPVAERTLDGAQDAQSSASPLVPVGFAIGGLGIVSVAVGIATGILAIDKKGIIDALCTPTTPPECPPAGLEAARDGAAFATTSTATIIGGAVLTALGTTFVLVGYGSSSAAPDTSLTLGPGTGASMWFRF